MALYRALIASMAIHLAVAGGVVLVGTGGSSSPRADSVISVDLKEAPGGRVRPGKGDGTAPPAFHKRPEAASPISDETPAVASAPPQEAIAPEADSLPPTAEGGPESKMEGGTGGDVAVQDVSVQSGDTASLGETSGASCEKNDDVYLKIREAIERAKSYPLIARKRGLEGTALIGFHISESGTPMDIRVIKSSGYRVLDGEAVRIVKKAAPYPPLGRTIEVPISFRLK